MSGGNLHMENTRIAEFTRHDLERYQHIIIYGAGVMGKRMVQELASSCAEKLTGIAVTDMKGNPSEICDYPVRSISSYINHVSPDDTAILISVTRAALEIVATVQACGFYHVFVIDPEFENVLLENYLSRELHRLQKEACVQC